MNNRTMRDMEQPISKIPSQIRTEQEILKDFEKLGYKVKYKDDKYICLIDEETEVRIEVGYIGERLTYKKFYEEEIDQRNMWNKPIIYEVACNIDMQEHKLLHELFSLWGGGCS